MRHVRCETPPLMESTNARRSPEETSQTGSNLDNLPQYIDLQTLEDVILAEYQGKKADPSLIYPQLRCRSTFSLEVGDLFDKAFMFEDQGDLENGENVYLELLGRPHTELDMGAVFDALRGILRVRAIGCEYAPALLELERLVAGCLCLYGPDSAIYRELSVELAISYYKLERFEEGNALVKRILSIYRDYSGRLNELSCERLLFWTSSRLIGLSLVPNFNSLCTRLLKQYQDGGKVDSALILATDITDGLQFSNSFDEAEVYLHWVVSLYETHGNFELAQVQISLAHIETISCVLLNQLTNFPQSTVIKERFVDKLQRDILRYFTPPKPKPPPVIPLTRLALCYTALGLHSKAHALYEIIDLEDKALRASCSRENWKLLIQGLGDEACNLASLSELEDAERLFILAEEIAQRELGATHWRTKRAVAELNAFHHRDPDLWEGRFIVRLRSVGVLRDALTSPTKEVVLI
jgi:tetratricopeptide (TPR) repeat protein